MVFPMKSGREEKRAVQISFVVGGLSGTLRKEEEGSYQFQLSESLGEPLFHLFSAKRERKGEKRIIVRR